MVVEIDDCVGASGALSIFAILKHYYVAKFWMKKEEEKNTEYIGIDAKLLLYLRYWSAKSLHMAFWLLIPRVALGKIRRVFTF